jgi:hypothetical protein
MLCDMSALSRRAVLRGSASMIALGAFTAFAGDPIWLGATKRSEVHVAHLLETREEDDPAEHEWRQRSNSFHQLPTM